MEATKIAEIVEMHKAGIAVSAIASEMGASVQTIYNVLENQGIEIVKPKRVIDEEAVIAAYQNTALPIKEVLDEYDIGYTALYSILARHEIPTRQVIQEKGKAHALDTAINMYIEGIALWKIKAETGVHQSTLHQALHERDVPIRRPLK